MSANGKLDLKSLVLVDGWAYLIPNTAVAWNGACDEMVALGYPRPAITAPDGAYRDLPGQRYWKKYWTDRGLPGNAATPGYSDHGWGTDADIFKVYLYPRAVLREVFARWGFTFNVPHELWHIHHDGASYAALVARPIDVSKRKRNPMTIAHIKEPTSKTVFALDLADVTKPLRAIRAGEMIGAGKAGIDVAEIPSIELQGLMRERGILVQDQYLRPVAYTPEYAAAHSHTINWSGFAVTRPN